MRRGQLVDRGGVQVRRLLRDHYGPAQRRRGPEPAQPEPRRHDLGEAAEQGRAVLRPRVGGEPGDVGALVAEVPVRVVLHQPQPQAGRYVGHRRPAGARQGAAGRVLEGGDGVEQLRPLPRDDLRQGVGEDAVLVARHGHHARARQPERLQGRQVGGVLDEDHVPRFDQGGGDEGESLLGTRGDQYVVGPRHQPPRRRPGRDGLAQLRRALGRRVLERPPRGHREGGVVRGPQAFGVEELGRGETAGEGDDPAACGQREDLAYGGALDAREACGRGRRGRRRGGEPTAGSSTDGPYPTPAGRRDCRAAPRSCLRRRTSPQMEPNERPHAAPVQPPLSPPA